MTCHRQQDVSYLRRTQGVILLPCWPSHGHHQAGIVRSDFRGHIEGRQRDVALPSSCAAHTADCNTVKTLYGKTAIPNGSRAAPMRERADLPMQDRYGSPKQRSICHRRRYSRATLRALTAIERHCSK